MCVCLCVCVSATLQLREAGEQNASGANRCLCESQHLAADKYTHTHTHKQQWRLVPVCTQYGEEHTHTVSHRSEETLYFLSFVFFNYFLVQVYLQLKTRRAADAAVRAAPIGRDDWRAAEKRWWSISSTARSLKTWLQRSITTYDLAVITSCDSFVFVRTGDTVRGD